MDDDIKPTCAYVHNGKFLLEYGPGSLRQVTRQQFEAAFAALYPGKRLPFGHQAGELRQQRAVMDD